MTIAEFKSTGSSESSFGPEDLKEIPRRKEESLRFAEARARAANKRRAARENRQREQGDTGN